MIYLGLRTKSQIPKNAVRVDYHHTEQRGKQAIEWFEVWGPDRDQVKPIFGENEIPNPSKIRRVEQWVKGNFLTDEQ